MSGPINPTTLAFTAPQTNADGTNLDDLASYNVYTGTSASGPWVILAVVPAATPDPPAGQVVTVQANFASLAPGQYFATVTAVDLRGNESVKATPVPFAVGDVVAPSPPTNLVVS